MTPMEEEELCPLITPYTYTQGIDPSILQRLFALRKWELDELNNPIPFRWPECLRKTLYNTYREEETHQVLRLRQYQIQGIYHLSRMHKFILGDAVGLGKTVQTIASFCAMKDKNPDLKLIIVTTKSTSEQWADEIRRFSYLNPYVLKDNYKGLKSSGARFEQFRRFLSGGAKDVLIAKYSSLIGTRRTLEEKFDEEGNPTNNGKERVSLEIKTFSKILREHKENVVLVFDEAHRFKNVSSTRTLVINLTYNARWVWALTATVIQNGMEEFASIACAIGIKPFESMWEFKEKFCVIRKKYIGRGKKKDSIVGYKNVAEFKAMMRPFYLGRSQRHVKEPLPILITEYHPLDLDKKQTKLLLEDIPNGTFQLPPILIKVGGDLYEKERDPSNEMTMLSVQQLISNHWALLDKTDEKSFHTTTLSPKEEALLDMLDGDLRGEKVVVYTKFRSHIDRIQWLCENDYFTERKFIRITGAENEKQREEAKKKFQDPSSGYDFIMINDAALEGVNLQSAGHLICFDLPMSLGKIVQLVGRLQRMNSIHATNTLHILISKGTIDEYVVDLLKSKNKVFSSVLGDAFTAGLLDNDKVIILDSGMENTEGEYSSLLKAFVKSVPMKHFIEGYRLEKAQSDNYRMSFEKGKKERLLKVDEL